MTEKNIDKEIKEILGADKERLQLLTLMSNITGPEQQTLWQLATTRGCWNQAVELSQQYYFRGGEYRYSNEEIDQLYKDKKTLLEFRDLNRQIL
ncbi:hypothetical protein BH10PAT1_BH10PAT1_2590 [soil metagenome]